MSEIKVNKISPRSGTTVTLGDSGGPTANGAAGGSGIVIIRYKFQ